MYSLITQGIAAWLEAFLDHDTGPDQLCTGAVMAKVASTPGSIGYVSLDVLDDTVKALKLEGVEPTAENIKAGNYFLSRPFVMATKGEISEQSEPVQALFDYLSSAEGKDLISSIGLITVD